MISIVVYDIETRTLAKDHPRKWGDIENFGMSLAVTWDNVTNTFRTFEDAKDLYYDLLFFDRVVSFNGLRFDNVIVAHDAEGDADLLDAITFDMLADLNKRLGRRVKLDQVAEGTLNRTKVAVGTQAVEWWKAAEMLRIMADNRSAGPGSAALRLGADCLLKRLEHYCRMDVEILRDIYRYGCDYGRVRYLSRGKPFDVSVDWPRDWYKEEE